MNNKAIIINRNEFFHMGKKYKFLLEKDLHFLGKRRVIIILEEEIFTVDVKVDGDKNYKWFIENKINLEFKGDIDYLFDYKKINNKVYRIYAIKGGERVEFLSEDSKKVEVVPIQNIFKKVIDRKVKDKNCIVVIYFRECFYLMKLERSELVLSLVLRDKESLKSKINEYQGLKVFYEDMAMELLGCESENKFIIKKKGGEINIL